MSEQQYAEGGYVMSGEFVTAYLHVDECLIAKRGDDTFQCVRGEHDHGDHR